MYMGVFLVEGSQAPVKSRKPLATPSPPRLAGSLFGLSTKKPLGSRRRQVGR